MGIGFRVFSCEFACRSDVSLTIQGVSLEAVGVVLQFRDSKSRFQRNMNCDKDSWRCGWSVAELPGCRARSPVIKCQPFDSIQPYG